MFGFFATVFAIVARSGSKIHSARWASLAFAIGLVGILMDTIRSPFPPLFFTLAVPLHWASILCLLNAFLSRNGATMPRLPTAIVFAVGLAVNTWFSFVDPEVTVRVPNANLTALALISVGLPYFFAQAKGFMNRITLSIQIAVWSCYAIRTVLYFSLNQSAEYGAHAIWSQYMMLFYFSTVVLALAVAMQLVLTITSDLIEQKHTASAIDALTEIANRRGLNFMIEAHERHTHRIGAVAMIDLDNFKVINDTYGHAIGDAVLRVAAQTIKQHVTGLGEGVRMGGEEFAVLIYATHAEAASAIAQLLRTAISAARLGEPHENITFTASIGLAILRADETVTDAIRRADIALYSAKNSGRNQVAAAA